MSEWRKCWKLPVAVEYREQEPGESTVSTRAGGEMNNTPIRDCPRCNEPYYVYSMIVADQSMCPSCRARLERRIEELRPKKDGERLEGR